MHCFFKHFICSDYRLVPFIFLCYIYLQRYIFQRFSEGKFINGYCIRTSEIMNCSIVHANSGMTYKRNNPCYDRQSGPYNTVWVFIILYIDFWYLRNLYFWCFVGWFISKLIILFFFNLYTFHFILRFIFNLKKIIWIIV